MVVGSFIPVLCPVDVGMLEEEDVVMILLVVSEMVTSRSMVDLDSACGAKHKDRPFWLVVIGLSFSFDMYGWMRFLMYFFCDVFS